MPRSLSAAARGAVYAPETGELFAILLELTHPQWVTPIYVNSSGSDLVSNKKAYQQFPFEFVLPAENDEAPPTVTLRICNVDRHIVQNVRAVTNDRVQVAVSVVMASTPDVIEAGPYEFTLRDCSWDAIVVEGTLAIEDILNEPYPAEVITPNTMPGVF